MDAGRDHLDSRALFDGREALTVLQSAFLGHEASGQLLLTMLLAEKGQKCLT